MKVIFLDFDGVLNTFDFLFLTDGDDDSEGIDPRAVRRVNEIVRRTGAVVCLSTAWRLQNTMSRLREILHRRGFEGKIIGRTPDLSFRYAERGEEVQAWLDKHTVESFVVLDDLAEFDQMSDRHIHTDHRHGLVDDHIESAVRILERPLSVRDEVQGL